MIHTNIFGLATKAPALLPQLYLSVLGTPATTLRWSNMSNVGLLALFKASLVSLKNYPQVEGIEDLIFCPIAAMQGELRARPLCHNMTDVNPVDNDGEIEQSWKKEIE